MRISNNQLYGSFIKYDRVHQEKLEKYDRQIASGKKLLAPSDDTVATTGALKLKESNSQVDNYLRNITIVQSRQEAAQTALTNIYDTAQDAKVEIVRLLNHGVLDHEDAQIVDDYLQGLKKYIVDQANTKVGDVYIFSGTKTDQKPFNEDGSYNGNTNTQKIPVSRAYELEGTFNGAEKLGTKDNRILIVKVLDEIHQAIQSGDLSSVDDQKLEVFEEGMNEIAKQRSLIGAQASNLEDFKIQHESQKTLLNEMISSLEDVDITKAISKMEQTKVAYEASMAVFSQNKDLSLLKYFAA